MKKDIQNIEDIKTMVDEFYGKIREDALLGPIFNNIIQNRWNEHLPKMYSFWETVLLGNHTYYGSPFSPHAQMPLEKEHFNHWLLLFSETLTENFEGEKANEALWRAEKMAEMFQFKIQHIKNSNSKPII